MVKHLNIKYSAISKVLPCVYDDSLSYYEVLCKVRDKLNEVIDVDNAQSDAINDLGEQSAERYNEFEQRILHDLEEMENKLEGEISAGDDEVLQTLSELIANLSNEIDDISATVSGVESSVAEAVQTANSASEAVNELNEDVETVTQNVADIGDILAQAEGAMRQMSSQINNQATTIGQMGNDINNLTERVTDIEEEIAGGMVFADVDSDLSTTSTNPVENQVITRKIQQVEGDIPSQLDDLSDVSFSNPSAGQVAGFDSNGNLINMNAPAGVTVVDNLNSTSSTDALSAKQGNVLAQAGAMLQNDISNLNSFEQQQYQTNAEIMYGKYSSGDTDINFDQNRNITSIVEEGDASGSDYQCEMTTTFSIDAQTGDTLITTVYDWVRQGHRTETCVTRIHFDTTNNKCVISETWS